MLAKFIKEFDPAYLSPEDIISKIREIAPIILTGSDEEQVAYWEFIGAKLNEDQKVLLTLGVSNLFRTEEQTDNYAKGIVCLSNEIAEFEDSIKYLKGLNDESLEEAIGAMEDLRNEINKSHKKAKLN